MSQDFIVLMELLPKHGRTATSVEISSLLLFAILKVGKISFYQAGCVPKSRKQAAKGRRQQNPDTSSQSPFQVFYVD